MAQKKLVNMVSLEGLLYEHKLEKKVSGDNSKNPGTEYITGTISIATDGMECLNIVPVHFSYVTATTSTGKPNRNYGLFVPNNELTEKLSFYEIINSFLEKYAAKFCTPSTIQTYQSLLKNHILPYFKNQKPEEINDLVIKDFCKYCEEKDLSPRRFKN